MFNNCRITATTRNGVRLATFTVSAEGEVDTQHPRLNRLADTVLNRMIARHGAAAYYFHNRYSTSAAPVGALLDPQAIDRALPPAAAPTTD